MSQSLDKVPDVDIDGHGRFKYILINVQDESSNASKSIVRGYARAQWHADIFDRTTEQLQPYPSLRAKCLGGGRIEHDPDEKTIKVYGYSQARVALVGGTGEIRRSLSQMLKQTSKLNVLALYDVASLNKQFTIPFRLHTFSDGEPQNILNSRMLTMLEKPRTAEDAARQETVRESTNYLPNGPSKIAKNETEELVNILRQLPVAEEGTMNHSRKSKVIASQRKNTASHDIEGSVARAKDQRNRGPLSMIGVKNGSRIASSLEHRDTTYNTGLVPKNRFEDSLLLQDRSRNDDYFPQGDEFEDEIGLDVGQLTHKYPSANTYREEDTENFVPAAILSGTEKSLPNASSHRRYTG
ncbi:Sex-regulated protein janus-A [Dufourea novaeangliae]|uniref:Sex-regulated protein janus-A n=1 Tax=Dufourea novaeangliae TaxID=178035 RepID=A0A154PJ50_DUFNO|nr:Sex-regulated protein janus-A [Dufourea novaeangliae]